MNKDFLTEVITLEDLLTKCVDAFEEAKLFYGHGTDNPWDDAIALTLPTLNIPLDTDDSVLTRLISPAEKQALLPLLAKRIQQRLPVPYITGEAWFMGYPFYVNEQVLIPRSPFAELIAEQFSPWVSPDKVTHILEIGTGSGCMAIACAQVFPQAQIDATDIESQALKVAQRNVERYQKQTQINLWQGDLYQPLKPQQYDIIISNPPYVDPTILKNLPLEYHYEPKQALVSEEAGLAHVKRLLQGAHLYLKDTGVLIIEVGEAQAALEGFYPQVPFLWLECQSGGEGIFLLTADQVRHYFE